jgi:hypothetical protein
VDRPVAFVAILATIAAASLAGCGAPPGSREPSSSSTASSSSGDGSPGSGQAGTPVGPLRLALIDCTYFTTNFYASADAINAVLPQGLAAEETLPGVGGVLLETYTCKSFVIGNRTTVSDAALALALVQVEAGPGLARDGAFHSFLLEAFADDEVLVAAFADAGTPASVADIAADTGPVGRASVASSDGQVSYEWTAAAGRGAADGDFLRRIFLSADLAIDVDYTWHWESLNREAVLQSSQGAVQPLLLPPGTGRGAAGGFDGVFGWKSLP